MIGSPFRLKNPIVLIHGFCARGTYGPVDYFYGIPRLLKQAGNLILIARLPSLHRIEHRAAQLKHQIERAFPHQQVNLIGHSMGGIEAHLVAAQGDFTERVASVTTIGTPNRGTFLADHTQKVSSGFVNRWCQLAGNRGSEFTRKAAQGLLELLESDLGCIEQLGTSFCRDYLPKLAPNQPGVAYFSATSAIARPAVRNSLPLFWLPHRLLLPREGDNDGFVSVESAKWGQHICTYAGDHYAQIGHLLGRSRGLDHLKFFEEIFKRLKREGM